VYALPEWIAANPTIPATEITDIELQKISNQQAPNQVFAIVQAKAAQQPIVKGSLAIVLDGIQDPGNLGTIIRIADWFGIAHIICSHDTAELYNPKVVQSTMGSFTRTNILYTDLEAFLSASTLPVYGTLLDGRSIYETSKPKEGLLIIGNEGKGIRPAILPFVKHPLTIPRIGGAESLNAAVATGIVISHLV
jgi:TrmH family RNA methyltransferase